MDLRDRRLERGRLGLDQRYRLVDEEFRRGPRLREAHVAEGEAHHAIIRSGAFQMVAQHARDGLGPARDAALRRDEFVEIGLPSAQARRDAVLAVRLIDKRTGRPVPDAVVFAKRIDMAPDGMETMTSRIEQAATVEAGVYRFDVRLTMAGNWRLSLAAKVQGEPGTVETRLAFRAVK